MYRIRFASKTLEMITTEKPGGNKNLLGRIIVYISLLSRHHAKIDPTDNFRSARKLMSSPIFHLARVYICFSLRVNKKKGRGGGKKKKKEKKEYDRGTGSCMRKAGRVESLAPPRSLFTCISTVVVSTPVTFVGFHSSTTMHPLSGLCIRVLEWMHERRYKTWMITNKGEKRPSPY